MQPSAAMTALSSRFADQKVLRQRMTHRLGLVTPRRFSADWVSDTRATMLGCQTCTRSRDCALWLDDGGAAEPPGFCPIHDVLLRMQAA